ncbi:MAG: ribose transport system ATP-binding protein [Rhodospirillaceae bacterium]|jgi:ribose transport system ATP-binding protein|nr:ribose transport system ATP-binding protein [Rhodospirillaceae bacterium]
MSDVAAPTDSSSCDRVLAIAGVSKSYGGVKALRQVDLDVRRGEVHVLFGENGAGKSTLIGIIAGSVKPDEGTIDIEDRRVHFDSVSHARRHGVSAVFQEFSVAPDLSVEDNIFLGVEPGRGIMLDKRKIRTGASEILTRLGFAMKPAALASTLSRGQQQMVEIAKALATRPKILILDEPTASLTDRESEKLFELIAALTAQGVAIIYITHRIAEIGRIGDRVTVLRDGAWVATRQVKELSSGKLVELMTGRPVGDFFPRIEHRPGPPLLRLRGLTTRNRRVNDVSLEVRAGEIVGLAGLVGCGKSEIGRACFGIERIASGTVEFLGRDITRSNPRRNLDQGLCYIPSDRRREGLLLARTVRENISAASLGQVSRLGVIRPAAERSLTRRLGEKMQIRPFHQEREVRKYSGGNQQKIMLAKYIANTTKVFIFDEPTIGIDVGTKIEIYNFLAELVANGVAVLLISSELNEILNLSNRVYVIHNGSVRAELASEEISERNVLSHFFQVDARDT